MSLLKNRYILALFLAVICVAVVLYLCDWLQGKAPSNYYVSEYVFDWEGFCDRQGINYE